MRMTIFAHKLQGIEISSNTSFSFDFGCMIQVSPYAYFARFQVAHVQLVELKCYHQNIVWLSE